MTINRTTLLDLPLPVTGTESGTWGNITNNGLSQYVDIAVAGMNNLTSANFSPGDLTISNTQGDSGGTNIAAGSAQYATIKVSSLAQNSTITAPASNRSYRIVNADVEYNLTIKASGQPGITFLPGQTGVVAFTGTDYEVVGVVNAASSTDNAVPRFDGTTGQIIKNTGVTIDDSNNVSGVAQLNATTADLTNIEVTNIKAKDGTSAGSIADSTGVVTLASSVLTTTDINGGTIDGAVIGGASAAAGSFTTLNTSGQVVFNDAGADVDFRVEGDTDVNLLFVDASTDRVGIGTSTPTTKLQVDGPADIGGETNNVGIFGSSSTNAGIIGTTANQQLNIYGNGTGPIVFQTGGAFLNGLDVLGTERMRIDSSGNLGLGTTTAVTKATVYGSGDQKLSLVSPTGSSTQVGINLSPSMTDAEAAANPAQAAIYATDSSYSANIIFANKATGAVGNALTERMRIDSSGNVGIGTSSPSVKFEVNGRVLGESVVAGNALYVWSQDRMSLGASYGIESQQSSPFFLLTNSAQPIVLGTNNTERMRIDSSGQVIVGPFGGNGNAVVAGSSSPGATNQPGTNLLLKSGDGSGSGFSFMTFSTSPAGSSGTTVNTAVERARIASDGSLILNSTNNSSSATDGKWYYLPGGEMYVSRNGGIVSYFNRNTDDGTIIEFRQANSTEGSISVSGSTVSYNGGHLSRWAQMLTKPELFKGTVMSNLDEMNVYIAPTTYWTEEDELPEGVSVGDVKVETHEVDNEQLNKVKVSDVEGDANVAGVFVNWTYDEAHQVDEINMAMTGDMIIRIAEGVTVARGDLLMSAGDGTAKPQGDDIVRSKTIAKVTSTHVTCTYEDGSYCVPCVLMAC
jgi:hypothetical protein